MIDGFVYTDYAKGLLVFWFGGGGDSHKFLVDKETSIGLHKPCKLGF
jgi:coproporphyrinogen III oxidase